MIIEVKPKDGLIVPHPETGQPMKAGKVEKTPAIIRLIKDGDLEEVKQAKAAKKAPAKKKEAE